MRDEKRPVDEWQYARSVSLPRGPRRSVPW